MKSLFVKWIGLAVLTLSFQAAHAYERPVQNLSPGSCVIVQVTKTEVVAAYYCPASVDSIYEIGWLVVGVKILRDLGSSCVCRDSFNQSVTGVEGILDPSMDQYVQYWKFKTSHLVNWE